MQKFFKPDNEPAFIPFVNFGDPAFFYVLTGILAGGATAALVDTIQDFFLWCRSTKQTEDQKIPDIQEQPDDEWILVSAKINH